MTPRANDGLDFTPILTHYLFLFTSFLSIIAWFLAFISQAFATSKFGHSAVGVLWFAIFLQLFLILGVLYTLATDSVGMNRHPISIFGSITIVFAVIGVNQGIFAGPASLNAMAAGWLVLAIVDILWVLYFTAEDESLTLHVFNSMGTGGLTPPSRRRRTRTQASIRNMQHNAYASNYSSGGGDPIGSHDPYDPKTGVNGSSPYAAGATVRSQHSQSFVGSIESPAGNRSMGQTEGIRAAVAAANSSNKDNLPNSPLMVGIGAGGSGPNSAAGSASPQDPYQYRARALYNYNANQADPNEISFRKDEYLDIMDQTGKWWQAKKADGTVGIAPSNYLQIT